MLGSGMPELVMTVFPALSIFEPKRLPKLKSAIGRGIRSFGKAVTRRHGLSASKNRRENQKSRHEPPLMDHTLQPSRNHTNESSYAGPNPEPGSTPVKTSLLRGEERILFVDDDDTVVELNQLRLGRLGYEVVATTSSLDALEIFRKEPETFDLVFIDYAMPDLTGAELAAELLKVNPMVPIIMSSGYTGSIKSEDVLKMGIKAFVMKPPTKHEVAEAIRRVLDEHASQPKGPGKEA